MTGLTYSFFTNIFFSINFLSMKDFELKEKLTASIWHKKWFPALSFGLTFLQNQ